MVDGEFYSKSTGWRLIRRELPLTSTNQGQTVTITTTNQDAFSGIFWGASTDSDDSAYLLKMVRQIKNTEKGQANGVQEDTAAYVGIGEDHDMTFNVKDVTELAVDGVQLGSQDKYQNGECHRCITKAN